MPVSVWMVDALALQPGYEVLELAAGTGEVGFLAAEQIAPGGTLISSDFSPEMITAAQERAEQMGIANVRFRQIDAEGIDQPAASLDGVLCRWGYMLMADGEAALRETRRVLRPGARVALAAWTRAGENPWASIPARSWSSAATRAPRPQRAGPVRVGAARARSRSTSTPRASPSTRSTPSTSRYVYPSVDAWIAMQRDLASRFREALDGLDRRRARGRARRDPRAGAPVRAGGRLDRPAGAHLGRAATA